MNEPQQELKNNRVLILDSANYWFQAARAHQNNGEFATALCCRENAINHLENELYACRNLDLSKSQTEAPSEPVAKELGTSLNQVVSSQKCD